MTRDTRYARSGDANIAYQVAGNAPRDLVLEDLVAGSGLRSHYRGSHTLKGVPGEWRLFAVEAEDQRE